MVWFAHTPFVTAAALKQSPPNLASAWFAVYWLTIFLFPGKVSAASTTGRKSEIRTSNNADPEKLKEAIRIFRDSVSDTEYPVGTILQLIPTEAMVKHPRGTFAKSNDWEFFSLDVSAAGTKISERGDNVVNHTQGLTCLSCHQPAAKYDFVCEKTHGCAPIPLDDQKIAELQGADLRCAKK
jgi:hypothetical protein